MQKFETLQQPLLGELAMSWRERGEREEEKKMPFIVATYVYASSQGQRTHSARTNYKLLINEESDNDMMKEIGNLSNNLAMVII